MSFIVPEGRRKVHSGQRFMRLEVVGVPFYLPVGKNRFMHQFVVCRCDCGSHVIARANALGGDSKSCGCWRRDEKVTHGMHGTPLYRAWRGIFTRCYNENSEKYPRYGGRGIRLCAHWHSFSEFSAWSLANGYAPGLSLDRIDNNGHYDPDNCRWATWLQQNNNRSNTVLVTAFGDTMSLGDWTRDPRCAIPCRNTLWRRIRKLGWTPEKAMTQPLSSNGLPPSASRRALLVSRSSE